MGVLYAAAMPAEAPQATRSLQLIGVDVGAAAEPARSRGAEVDERAFAADRRAHGDGHQREEAARQRRAQRHAAGADPDRLQDLRRAVPLGGGAETSDTSTMMTPAAVGMMRRRHHGAACVTSSSEPVPCHAIDCTSSMKCTPATAPTPAMRPVSGTSTQKRRDGGDSSRR